MGRWGWALRGLGFFLVTLGPVTAAHLMKYAGWGEIADSVVTTAVFTAAFLLGGPGLRLLPGENGAVVGSALRSFAMGAMAGGLMQAFLWSFWLLLPQGIRYSLGEHALALHLVLAAVLGFVAAAMPGRRECGA
jgi:hypothetical protein